MFVISAVEVVEILQTPNAQRKRKRKQHLLTSHSITPPNATNRISNLSGGSEQFSPFRILMQFSHIRKLEEFWGKATVNKQLLTSIAAEEQQIGNTIKRNAATVGRAEAQNKSCRIAKRTAAAVEVGPKT